MEGLLPGEIQQFYTRIESDGASLEDLALALGEAMKLVEAKIIERDRRMKHPRGHKFGTLRTGVRIGTGRAVLQFTAHPKPWVPNQYGTPAQQEGT